VKFRHLVQRAKLLGADCLTTGHYARIERGDPDAGIPHRLYRAVDTRKDQSYVLYTLTQEQLDYIQFPLGGLTKPETRRLARAYGLPVADKAESQEICFVGNRSYADFVAERRPDVTKPGDIVTKSGDVLGQHKGLVNHTVGQRRGIGIAAPKPYFVLNLDTESNRLVVGDREDAEAVALQADNVSLMSEDWSGEPFEAEVVVRYRGLPHLGRVEIESAEDRTVRIELSGDSGPIASPGQAVVFYQGDQVLGGGTISDVVRRGTTAASA
jgi:tRNA-specific 2-thiouridylase